MTAELATSSVPPLKELLLAIQKDRRIEGARLHLGDQRLHISLADYARPWVFAALSISAPLMIVTANSREAQDLVEELKSLMGDKAAILPAWETLPHERLSPSADIVGQRAKVLSSLEHYRIVVTPARSYCQPVVPPQPGESLELAVDAEYDFEELTSTLVHFGYSHVDMVSQRGEFATRGGIIDVFPTTDEHAVRLEFWGDELTDIREFSVLDQRALADAQRPRLSIYPAKALLLTDAVRNAAQSLAQGANQNPELVEMLLALSEGSYRDGMEVLIPTLAPEPLVPLPSILPSGWHVVELAPQKLKKRVADLQATDAEFLAASWDVAAMGGSAPLTTAALGMEASSFLDLDTLHDAIIDADLPLWTASPPGMLEASEDQTLPLEFEAGPQPRGELAAIDSTMRDILERTLEGHTIVYIAPNAGVVKRMTQRFAEKGIAHRVGRASTAPRAGEVTIYQALIHGGLVFGDVKVTVITESDFTGNRVVDTAVRKRRTQAKRHRVDPLALTPGDYVVHDTHGIGRFLGMTERTLGTGDDTSKREFVVLEYASTKRGAPPDKLYVPMDSIDHLSRYVGGQTPTLSKMGGSDWKNTKRKARAAVREIAAELIELYAKRQAAKGHSFAPDSPWQRELEDSFPYMETPDQLRAIDAVKADMEKPVPMDHVVIGDVGYGKTEVAVRAAFKAVQDGKQVAVLVPTTLLAHQHLDTFTSRMEGFPVTIRELSRFTSTADSKEIIKGLASGEVDIVIGTHRLLQTGITWKDLGLVVIDEEQRFGVEHKEHITSLRTHVDVLTMSATPIPRTLEMSMSGIREMSSILTAPENRHPVLTYVGAAEDQQVAAAIRRELLRDGQVFLVHNKVKDIEKRAQQIRDLVPEARVVVAHGQMPEQTLEATVQGFWTRDYDVLVCTTIVETGLDIANANTLIVDNAHHMGLAQLHQLRGRVGRSRERAYAYFLYPPDVVLTEDSYDRLATIANNNELGAGMAVAMKDLEMRGAGNVLGAEQSGHIAGVGFDLYMRLVGEAVRTFRAVTNGEAIDATADDDQEIRIDLPVDAHIPETYINAERLRLEVYRSLAATRTNEDLAAVREEIVDRYGTPPQEAQRLFALTRMRHMARAAGVNDVVMQGNRVKFHPCTLLDSKQVRLKRLYPYANYRGTARAIMVPLPKSGPRLTDAPLRDIELVQWVADFLAAMFDVDPQDVTTGGPRALPQGSARLGAGTTATGVRTTATGTGSIVTASPSPSRRSRTPRQRTRRLR